MYKKLKALMVERDITQKDLAKVLNINVSTLNFKLNGKSEFTLSEAFTISAFFGNKPLEEIFLKC